MINTIKNILFKAGWKLSRITVLSSNALQTIRVIQAHDINMVFDIGANTGQFGSELRAFGYTGKIVSFEPLPEEHKTLSKLAMHDSNWVVHERCAIGASSGPIEINVAGNSVSSSILPMLERHLKSAPQSRYVHTVMADMISLDSIYSQYCRANDVVLIKIDTQGYEWEVLDGAADALADCKGLLIELSLVPLYGTQRLWGDFIDRLSALKFSLYNLQPIFIDERTGRTQQFDGFFIKQPNE
jgi:FkbM family methyltransferase